MKLHGATKYIHFRKGEQHIYLLGEFHYLHMPHMKNAIKLSKFLTNELESPNSKLFLELNNTLKLSKSTFSKLSQNNKSSFTLKNISSVLQNKSNNFVKNKINLYDSREQVLKQFISKRYLINGYYAPLFYSNAIMDLKFQYFDISRIFDKCVEYWEKSVPATKAFFEKKIEVINKFNKLHKAVISNMKKNSTLRNEMTKGLINKNFINTIVIFIRDIIGMLPEMNLLNKLHISRKKHNYALIGHFHINNIASGLLLSGWTIQNDVNHKNLIINLPSV